jgi:hypothetical protein
MKRQPSPTGSHEFCDPPDLAIYDLRNIIRKYKGANTQSLPEIRGKAPGKQVKLVDVSTEQHINGMISYERG